MNLESAKQLLFNSFKQRGIASSRVIEAMQNTPREEFVPKLFKENAYDDNPLPIENGQTISQPTIVAMMSEALKLNPDMKVLEIGTGSGYQAAILAKLCRNVYTIERHRQLYEKASQVFKKLGLTNIKTKLGDGSKGWDEFAPFDRIIVTAAAFSRPPQKLLDNLKDDGIMIIPVEEEMGNQILYRVTKDKEGYKKEIITYVRFVPLVEE